MWISNLVPFCAHCSAGNGWGGAIRGFRLFSVPGWTRMNGACGPGPATWPQLASKCCHLAKHYVSRSGAAGIRCSVFVCFLGDNWNLVSFCCCVPPLYMKDKFHLFGSWQKKIAQPDPTRILPIKLAKQLMLVSKHIIIYWSDRYLRLLRESYDMASNFLSHISFTYSLVFRTLI